MGLLTLRNCVAGSPTTDDIVPSPPLMTVIDAVNGCTA